MWLYFFVLCAFFSILCAVIAAVCISYILMGVSQLKTGFIEKNISKKKGGLIAFLLAAPILALVVIVFFKLVFPIIGFI
jgi:hypothetical protein